MPTLTCRFLSCHYCNQSKTDPNDLFGFCENPAPQIMSNGICSELGGHYHKAVSPIPIPEECKLKSNIIVLGKRETDPSEPQNTEIAKIVDIKPFMNPPEAPDAPENATDVKKSKEPEKIKKKRGRPKKK